MKLCDEMIRRAIITGPTGAIGIALIEELIKNDIAVTAVCHCDSKRIRRIPSHTNVKVVQCNLDEILSLAPILDHDYDICYHFAWTGTIGESRNNIDVQQKNIQYTLDVVELAGILGCKRFIGAGSQAEYGRTENKLNSLIPTFPENGYGIAKLCAGQLSRIKCEQLGMDHIWTRVLSVYGPCDSEKTLISSLICQLLNNEVPKCTKGEQIWDYIYSKDAARAFWLLGTRGVSGRIYCIGSGEGKELSTYIKEVRDNINPKLEIAFGDIPYGQKQVMHLQADISELCSDTGFIPHYDFSSGIQETIEWIRESK